MAVTINEFEVIPETPPAARGAGAGGSTSESDEPMTLEELEEMIQRELERLARLWAH